jgi:hypothetical protein
LLDINHGWTKNAYWNVNIKNWRKWCKCISPFLFNNSYGLAAHTMGTKCPNHVFCVRLVDLQIICAKYRLGTEFFPNDDNRKCLLGVKHGWTKNALWNVNNKKLPKRCKFVSPFLFNNTYGLHVLTMDTKCPNQVLYVWFLDLQNICAK